jgi:uncharacterized protein (TIGR00730 family)
MNPVRRICVFCGSRSGNRSIYLEQARALGEALATAKIGLVYGGASVGLMGAMANAALAAGGEVIGVIPERLKTREVAHDSLTELRVVTSMHERKLTMEQLSDAAAALPGGFGTFEEFFELVTWSQLGLVRKPLGLLNTVGYYDGFLDQVRTAIAEGFIPESHAELFIAAPDAASLIRRLLEFRLPVAERKWIGRDQT